MTDNILINLSIISKIELDNKIFMGSEGYLTIENNTIFQGITRFIFRNSRTKTISNLNSFYNSVFSYIDNVLPVINQFRDNKTKNANVKENPFDLPGKNQFDSVAYRDKECGLKTLLIYLRKSISGLENLRETYSADIVMTSKLDIILDNVRLYVNKLEKKINFKDSSV